MSKVILTVGDVQSSGYCVRGTRRWCLNNGIDFKKFVREGLPIEELEHIDDEILRIVIAKKLEKLDGR